MGHTGAKTELLSKAQHKPANNYLLSPPHRCCALVFSDPFFNFFALCRHSCAIIANWFYYQIDYLFARTRVHTDGFRCGALACGSLACHSDVARFFCFALSQRFHFSVTVAVCPHFCVTAPGVTLLCFLCLGSQEQLF